MPQYDNTNRFSIFANDRKEKDTQPDRTGTLNVDGVEYFIDGWIKTAESGRQYLQGTIKRKDKQATTQDRAQERQPQRTQAPAPRTHGDRPNGPKNRPSEAPDFEDSIPF